MRKDEFSSNILGERGGVSFELWKDRGDTLMTLTGGGGFSCRWSGIGNALFRAGKRLGCVKGWAEYGSITAHYSAVYRPVGNSYFCIYGWSRDPLVEYYIVESWGSWRPPGAKALGTFGADGKLYEVCSTVRTEQPSIDGTRTFPQFWSVRTDKPAGERLDGTVSISRHFEQWERLGLKLGRLYEASLTVEGVESSGRADIYINDIVFEKE